MRGHVHAVVCVLKVRGHRRLMTSCVKLILEVRGLLELRIRNEGAGLVLSLLLAVGFPLLSSQKLQREACLHMSLARIESPVHRALTALPSWLATVSISLRLGVTGEETPL